MKKKIIPILLPSATVLGLMFANKISAATREEGVDVSSYQGSSSSYFKTLKNKGAKFVIVKVGGSGGGEGYHYQNPSASMQLANAKANGLAAGAYFWSEFGSSSSEALRMAKLAVSDAKRAGLETSSVIAMDYEAGAYASQKTANTNAVITFMDHIKKAGYKPLFYSGASFARSNVDTKKLVNKYGKSALWIASYKTMNAQYTPDYNYFPSMDGIGIWQYADNWKGLNVDGNVQFFKVISNGEVTKKTPVKQADATTNKENGVKKLPKDNTYTVKNGDSWSSIAKAYGIDVNGLAKLNGATTKTMLHPGQKLKLTGYVSDVATKKPKKTTTKKKTVKKNSWIKKSGYFRLNTTIKLRSGASTSSRVFSTLYRGQVIKFDAYKISGGYVWLRQKRSNGYGFVASGVAKNGKRVSTWGTIF
ncbi:MAG: endolysin (endogenous virus) [Lactobacillus phage ViSo-2018a]|uniref:lysozyme n=1 Tax=Lactobacillus phage ViSo-2018a TaxID=2267607 RepID=A0A3G6JGZ1_9CAUD|nr:MAG: endolysin [Lactobacillus phage ViSo-2018a]AZA17349.1 MAG: Lysin [Lactobacillus phage ViSo-2018a]